MSLIIYRTIIALGLLGFLAFGVVTWQAQPVDAGQKTTYNEFRDGSATTTSSTGVNNLGDGLSTSTTISLSSAATASTSFAVAIPGADTFDLNVCVTASSSALASLAYRLEFTQDANVLSSTTTWFRETVPTTASGVTSYAYSEHRFNPATSTIGGPTFVCANLLNTPVSAKWVRVHMGIMGSNAIVWRSVAPKVVYD